MLAITTPAGSTPGATVELEPGGVSGGGREESQSARLYIVNISVLDN